MATFTFSLSDASRAVAIQTLLGRLVVALDSQPEDANETQFTYGLTGVFPAEFGGSVRLSPGAGTFTFPGGTFDPGETPTNAVASMSLNANRSPSESGSWQIEEVNVGFAALAAATTSAALAALILTGDDDIDGGRAGDILNLGAGSDRFTDQGGNNSIDGAGGDDRLVFTAAGTNRVQGGAGNDEIVTLSGRDSLAGGDGNDDLQAGGGKDNLSGGKGNDTVEGGAGADRLSGGAGRDQFTFYVRDGNQPAGLGRTGRDTITDFTRGQDKLVFDVDLFSADPFYDVIGRADFSGGKEIRWDRRGNDVVVSVNVDGDTDADWQLLLTGLRRLGAGDFDLG
jgi:Ca2+-binding RTX toxin-like protein